jgi:hypothetical protein
MTKYTTEHGIIVKNAITFNQKDLQGLGFTEWFWITTCSASIPYIWLKERTIVCNLITVDSWAKVFLVGPKFYYSTEDHKISPKTSQGCES